MEAHPHEMSLQKLRDYFSWVEEKFHLRKEEIRRRRRLRTGEARNYTSWKEMTYEYTWPENTSSNNERLKFDPANTNAGDEPAPLGGVFRRNRNSVWVPISQRDGPPLEPPPRNPLPGNSKRSFHQFKGGKSNDKIPNLEKRDTPYATHGGSGILQ